MGAEDSNDEDQKCTGRNSISKMFKVYKEREVIRMDYWYHLAKLTIQFGGVVAIVFIICDCIVRGINISERQKNEGIMERLFKLTIGIFIKGVSDEGDDQDGGGTGKNKRSS